MKNISNNAFVIIIINILGQIKVRYYLWMICSNICTYFLIDYKFMTYDLLNNVPVCYYHH